MSSGSTGTLQGCRTFEWGRGGGWLGRPLSLFTCMQTDASSRTSSVSMGTKGSVLPANLSGYMDSGPKTTPVSLRTEPCNARVCLTPGSRHLPCHHIFRRWQKDQQGLTHLTRKKNQKPSSPKKAGGGMFERVQDLHPGARGSNSASAPLCLYNFREIQEPLCASVKWVTLLSTT